MHATPPSSQVIASTLRSIRAANAALPPSRRKSQSLNMYLNSNFAFRFYKLTADVAAVDGLLRDKDGAICELNNDGNFYLNVSFYDWSNPKVQRLYQETMAHYVSAGITDGYFADHSTQAIQYNASSERWDMCNGGEGSADPAGRRCCVFTAEKAAAVNAGHKAALRATQQALGWRGVMINHLNESLERSSPDSTIWGDLVNLGAPLNNGSTLSSVTHSRMARVHEQGYALEVRVASSGYKNPLKNGLCNQGGVMDHELLATFLLQVQENMYWACFASQGGQGMPGRPIETALPNWFEEYDKPLGAPLGDATLTGTVFERRFASGTVATFDTSKPAGARGHVAWATDAGPRPQSHVQHSTNIPTT